MSTHQLAISTDDIQFADVVVPLALTERRKQITDGITTITHLNRLLAEERRMYDCIASPVPSDFEMEMDSLHQREELNRKSFQIGAKKAERDTYLELLQKYEDLNGRDDLTPDELTYLDELKTKIENFRVKEDKDQEEDPNVEEAQWEEIRDDKPKADPAESHTDDPVPGFNAPDDEPEDIKALYKKEAEGTYKELSGPEDDFIPESISPPEHNRPHVPLREETLFSTTIKCLCALACVGFDLAFWFFLGIVLNFGLWGCIALSAGPLMFAEIWALFYWEDKVRRRMLRPSGTRIPYLKVILTLIIVCMVVSSFTIHLGRQDSRLFTEIIVATQKKNSMDRVRMNEELKQSITGAPVQITPRPDAIELESLIQEKKSLQSKLKLISMALLASLSVTLGLTASLFLALFHVSLTVTLIKLRIAGLEKKILKLQQLVRSKKTEIKTICTHAAKISAETAVLNYKTRKFFENRK